MQIRTEHDVRRAEVPEDKDRTQFSVAGVSGLTLRVSRSSKTWRLESRRTGRKTLGRWPDVALAEAKSAARQLLGDSERERVNRKAGPVIRERERRTLADLLASFEENRGARLASWPAQKRAIAHHYGGMMVLTVDRISAEAILAHVARERTVAAKRAAVYLSGVLRAAGIDEGVGGRELADLVEEAPRTRVLSDGELRAVLQGADGLVPAWRDFVRGLVLTMARRGDLARAEIAHVDFATGIWHCRVHKTRGHNARIEPMPLSSSAARLLAGRTTPGAKYVFETSAGGFLRNNHDRMQKKLHRLSGTSNWTWHDLRRTARTIMARTGVPPHVAERCMSHAAGRGDAMIRVYDLHDHADEMRAAFEHVAAAVKRIEAGGVA